jgi:hypothetical protein
MIGDDIVGDVGGAQRCGLRALQVRTGKFRSVPAATALSRPSPRISGWTLFLFCSVFSNKKAFLSKKDEDLYEDPRCLFFNPKNRCG